MTMPGEPRRMKEEDKEAVRELIGTVFAGEVDILERVVFENPFNPPESFAVIEREGRVVSVTGLLPRRLRLGGARVEAGEVGAVGTHPGYRHRGLATLLLEYWLDHMRERDIPLAFLFGIPGFYEKFHFAYAVPHHSFDYTTIHPRLLKDVKGSSDIVPMEKAHLREVAEIFSANNRLNSLSAVRSGEYWTYRFGSSREAPHCWRVALEGDSVRGYLWLSVDPDQITVREAGARDQEAAASLSSYLCGLAGDGREQIGLRAPLDNPLARFLYDRGGRRATPRRIFPGTWAGMVRIMDLPRLLELMGPTLSDRLSRSRFYRFSGAVRIISPVGEATLEIERGQVGVAGSGGTEARLPAEVITPLITGYRDLDSFASGQMDLEPETRRLLSALFPPGYPYVWGLEESEETARLAKPS